MILIVLFFSDKKKLQFAANKNLFTSPFDEEVKVWFLFLFFFFVVILQ